MRPEIAVALKVHPVVVDAAPACVETAKFITDAPAVRCILVVCPAPGVSVTLAVLTSETHDTTVSPVALVVVAPIVVTQLPVLVDVPPVGVD